MTASIIIPIAIWQARRARREKLKREQEMVDAMLEGLTDEPAMTLEQCLAKLESKEGRR